MGSMAWRRLSSLRSSSVSRLCQWCRSYSPPLVCTDVRQYCCALWRARHLSRPAFNGFAGIIKRVRFQICSQINKKRNITVCNALILGSTCAISRQSGLSTFGILSLPSIFSSEFTMQSYLKVSISAGLLAMLLGQSAMAQSVSSGTLNSQCSNPAELYTIVTGRDPNAPERQTPVFHGDILNAGEPLTVLLTTGISQNVPHVPGCSQTIRLTHASNYAVTNNPVCGSAFIPSVGIGRAFGCIQTTPTTIETRTIAETDSGETRVAWTGTIKPSRRQCVEQVPLTVSMGYEKLSYTFWLKNDYVIRKGRWAKCSTRDWEQGSALKISPF